MVTTYKVLLTGATGYIGGSVLSALLTPKGNALQHLIITVLVRSAGQAHSLAKLDVEPALFKDLDDTETLEKAAAEHDIVIHTASGFHKQSAEALISGLGKRRRETGSDVYYIHTSGTWNLAEGSLTNDGSEWLELSDEDDVHSREMDLETRSPFAQRSTDLRVVSAAQELGVKTIIVMAPDVYGYGTGLFSRQSLQIPDLVRSAIQAGSSAYVKEVTGEVGHVHVQDLAALYAIIVDCITRRVPLRTGRRGIYFCSGQPRSWRDVAFTIGEVGARLGILPLAEPQAISVEDAAKRWTGGDIRDVKLGYCAKLRLRPKLAVELGWTPQKTDEDWLSWIEESFKLAQQ